MKKLIFTGLLLVAAASGSFAQSKTEKKVAVAVSQLRQAMIDANQTSLEQITADQLSYGHSGGGVENKAEFIGKLTSGKSDFLTMDLSEQTIAISGKTALVRHLLKASINDGGKLGDVKLKVLLVWQKQQGKWKLLARQAVKLPL